MGTPVCAGLPLVFGLAAGQIGVDFDLIEA
jgi:hypothetical protein